MSFKIVNAKKIKNIKFNKKKNLNMAYIFNEILIINWHTEIYNRLFKRKPGHKIKYSGEAYDIN